MNRLDRIHRRELEQELRDVPTSPPPSDLLDRIHADIPKHLTAANESGDAPPPRRPWHRTPLFRMAASIAVVTLGVTLAWRTLEERSARLRRARASEPGDSIPASHPRAGGRIPGEARRRGRAHVRKQRLQ